MDNSHPTMLDDIRRFYELMDVLEVKCGGKRLLKDCHGRMDWPKRGVYFSFEKGERRSDTGNGLRVVRVGTHAINARGNRRKLWDRLRAHRGFLNNGGGNHRGSIFRLRIGEALINRDAWPSSIAEHWGKGNNAPVEIRLKELPLERAVSQYIRNMPFLWLAVLDPPGPESMRACIESNAIALLSNFLRPSHPIDPPSQEWFGHYSKSERIRRSGLWNVRHVDQPYRPQFLSAFEQLIKDMPKFRD